MLKKTLFIAVLTVFLALPLAGNLAHAQTATTGELDTLKSQLISLLTQEIAVLQGQLDAMLAIQNQQGQKIAQLIATPTPVPTPPTFGGTPSPTAPTISLGDAECYNNHAGTSDPTIRMIAEVPVTITGTYGGLHYTANRQGGGQGGGMIVTPNSSEDEKPFQNLDPGTYDYTMDFYSTPVSTGYPDGEGFRKMVTTGTDGIPTNVTAVPIAQYTGIFVAPNCR